MERDVLIPTTKISETILDFGEPLFAQFDELPPIEVLRSALKIVITVWNGHTLSTPAWGEPDHLDRMTALVLASDVAPEMGALLESLSRRRTERFKDDPRAVGEWSIEPADDGFSFRCEARIPRS